MTLNQEQTCRMNDFIRRKWLQTPLAYREYITNKHLKESKMTEGYTSEEIYKMFNDSNLKQEFKVVINNRFNAMCQAMYHAVRDPELMVMAEPHGDVWLEEHNRVVTEYQRHHDPVSVGS